MRASILGKFAMFGCGLCVATVLVACAPVTPSERIAENPVVFNSLPPAQRILVQQGRIEKGMSPDAVLLAWGAPNSEPIYGQKNGHKTERWIYKGYEPVTVMSNSVGPYVGPYGWYDPVYPTSSTAYIPTQDAYVEFIDGKVSEWEKKGK